MTSQTPNPISLGTVLVIGGCGFLGHNIVNQLLNYPLETHTPPPATARVKGPLKVETNGASQPSSIALYDGQAPPPSAYPPLKGRYPPLTDTKVHILDLYTTRNILPGAEYHSADITSEADALEVFKKVRPDVVIHTASPPMVEGADREMWLKVNVDGTRTLLNVAGGRAGDWGGKCRAFVYTSSASVVHDSVSELIDRDETWPYCQGEAQKEYYSDTKVRPLLTPDLCLRVCWF
jgi:sterol-4alpha-carboxylate 3-dehydrogenase (decarboxylating)